MILEAVDSKARVGPIRAGRRGGAWLPGCGLLLGLVLPGGAAWEARAQQALPVPALPDAHSHRDQPGAADEPFGPVLSPERMQKLREDDRHKRLVADTERLVALSSELRAEVAKTSRDELSVVVVRKAAELEKLARDVKERMKN